MDKLIITAALTGAELTRAQQPALPISPDEIAQAAWECAQAGAAIVHVHARRADGSSTQEAAAYRSIIEAVRARCDVVVQVSTGGAVGMTAQERVAPLALRPEMATLSMGSVNFGDGVFLNPPPDIEHFLHTMRAHGVVPEFEVFDSGMLATLAGIVVIMLLLDWFLPFVYNVGFPGFQASVLVWLFLGGLVAIENWGTSEIEDNGLARG